MKTLVVANCNGEDTSWAKEVGKDWWVHLSLLHRPPGREASAYLEIINQCGLSDSDETVFCQGNPFAHDRDFLAHLADPTVRYFGTVHECDGNGAPHDNTPLDGWCEVLGLPVQESYRFVAGSQYRVTPAQIRLRRIRFYMVLYHLSMMPETRAAWVLERLWPIIWEIEL